MENYFPIEQLRSSQKNLFDTVLGYLEPKDICNLREANKKIKETIDNLDLPTRSLDTRVLERKLSGAQFIHREIHKYLPSLMMDKSMTIDLHLVQLHSVDSKNKELPKGCAQMDMTGKVETTRYHAMMEDTLYLLAFIQSFARPEECSAFFYYGKMEYASTEGGTHPIQLTLMPDSLYEAAGRLLENLYTARNPDPILVQTMRAIRFYMDSQLSVIRNIESAGEESKAERLLFLSLSLETIFHLKRAKASSDLKQVLRGLLDLKHGRSVEMMWKWCEGFFSTVDSVVRCESDGDQLFKENPNYHEYYGEVARKIFYLAVVAVFVDKLGLDSALIEKWGISRSNVYCYFWSEEELLHKIIILLMQVAHEAWNEEVMAELRDLTSLWAQMRAHPSFVASDQNVIKTKLERLCVLLRLIEENAQSYQMVKRYVHPRLIEELHIAA